MSATALQERLEAEMAKPFVGLSVEEMREKTWQQVGSYPFAKRPFLKGFFEGIPILF